MEHNPLSVPRTREAADEALRTYMDDHLAGSTAALQLVDHLIDTASAPDEREFFTSLRIDIDDDRQTLEDLMGRFGKSPGTLRNIGGWLVEKAARLKLMLDDPGDGGLKQLEALEMLVLGIHGKQELWGALTEVSATVPHLASADLQRLQRRADDQHARVETRRLRAAGRAFGSATIG
ncbi:MAG: hypothetical protein H0W08_24620 [Acidobacteria bacterium]|nr:hypothetical protein [Acidobacteriota bacterium]